MAINAAGVYPVPVAVAPPLVDAVLWNQRRSALYQTLPDVGGYGCFHCFKFFKNCEIVHADCVRGAVLGVPEPAMVAHARTETAFKTALYKRLQEGSLPAPAVAAPVAPAPPPGDGAGGVPLLNGGGIPPPAPGDAPPAVGLLAGAPPPLALVPHNGHFGQVGVVPVPVGDPGGPGVHGGPVDPPPALAGQVLNASTSLSSATWAALVTAAGAELRLLAAGRVTSEVTRLEQVTAVFEQLFGLHRFSAFASTAKPLRTIVKLCGLGPDWVAVPGASLSELELSTIISLLTEFGAALQAQLSREGQAASPIPAFTVIDDGDEDDSGGDVSREGEAPDMELAAVGTIAKLGSAEFIRAVGPVAVRLISQGSLAKTTTWSSFLPLARRLGIAVKYAADAGVTAALTNTLKDQLQNVASADMIKDVVQGRLPTLTAPALFGTEDRIPGAQSQLLSEWFNNFGQFTRMSFPADDPTQGELTVVREEMAIFMRTHSAEQAITLWNDVVADYNSSMTDSLFRAVRGLHSGTRAYDTAVATATWSSLRHGFTEHAKLFDVNAAATLFRATVAKTVAHAQSSPVAGAGAAKSTAPAKASAASLKRKRLEGDGPAAAAKPATATAAAAGRPQVTAGAVDLCRMQILGLCKRTDCPNSHDAALITTKRRALLALGTQPVDTKPATTTS